MLGKPRNKHLFLDKDKLWEDLPELQGNTKGASCMVLLFYFLVNIIAIFLFMRVKKNLHILEIMVYWMVATYLFQNFSAICYMNFKTIVIPNKLSYEFSHFLNRLFLYPVLMVAFLNLFIILKSKLKKLLLTFVSILLLTGLEWFADFLGVINHVHWRIWWSFSFWLAGLLILLVAMGFFRKILYRRGSHL